MSRSSHDAERERLLPRDGIPTCNKSQSKWSSQSISSLKDFCSRPSTPVLFCTFLLYFLTSFSRHIVEVPTIRLLELAACHQYYAHIGGAAGDHQSGVHGRLCNLPAVQNELSTLTGWKVGLDAVPALLLAIYYGSLAGKYGRKPVLLLFSTGLLLNLAWVVLICWLDDRLPIRLVWLSSMFILIGGGQRVGKAMLFTIVSDAVDASDRTRYLSLLSAIPHITTLISPPLSAAFMRISIWLPFEAAIGALAVTYILILAMPESSKLKRSDEPTSTTPVARPTEHPDDDRRPLLPPEPALMADIPPSAFQKTSHWYSEIRHLLRTPGLSFNFTIFFIAPIALVARAFVYQHASESFGWEMSTTTWLRVSQAVGASLVTLFALPLLNTFIHLESLRQAQKFDLAILRGSLLIASVGFAILWQAKANWVLAFALFVCGLSEAIQPANQGLATSLIPRELNARLFTTVAVLETVGKLAGGPIQSTLFSIGRGEGRGSSGVNFLASSGIFLGLLVVALLVRVKR